MVTWEELKKLRDERDRAERELRRAIAEVNAANAVWWPAHSTYESAYRELTASCQHDVVLAVDCRQYEEEKLMIDAKRNTDPEMAAQLDLLMHLTLKCPVGIYQHYKGGLYVVYGHSIDEATLAPLVHYFSIERRTRWTRTIEKFTSLTEAGAPRFSMTADVTTAELMVAAGLSS